MLSYIWFFFYLFIVCSCVCMYHVKSLEGMWRVENNSIELALFFHHWGFGD